MFDWAKNKQEVRKFAESGGLAPDDTQTWTQFQTIKSELERIERYISPDSNVYPQANLIGPVHVADGAQILPGAQIEGPAYVGKNSLIGTNSLVRGGSFIGRRSIIGSHCSCSDSVIGPESGIFHYSGLFNSIIDRDCHLSGFVITGATRPDLKPVVSNPEVGEGDQIKKRGCIIHRQTFISPHVVTFPDITIRENCFIGPFVPVEENVPPKTYLTASSDVNKRENKIKEVQIDDPPDYPFKKEFETDK